MSKQDFLCILKCLWHFSANLFGRKRNREQYEVKENCCIFKFQNSDPSSVTIHHLLHPCVLQCVGDGACLLPFADLKSLHL